MYRSLKMMVCILSVFTLISGTALAGHGGVDKPLEESVSIESVKFYQRVLERIAVANDGNRAAGTRGYDQSASYIGFWL